MTATRSSKPEGSSVAALAAPLGALGVMLTPWGWSTLKALLLEPIRINPPTWLRVLLAAVLLANVRSTPFAWHIRVLYPAFKALVVAQPWWPTSRSSASTLMHKPSQPLLDTQRLPLGRDIFDDISSHKFIATLDECDWNGHLSNSSYSKSLDFTRMAHNSPRFLKMYYDGGWVALGGSAFNFHREIPLLARYTIRMSIEAWDDKWLYVVGRFVAPASKGKADETLYCTSISRYVCKAGRRTIPPWLLIATSGYGTHTTTKSNWEKAEQLRNSYLDKHRQQYLESTGTKTIPAKVEAKLVKKAALLRQFRTVAERAGTEDEAWMSKSFWHTDEWETRRKEGLQRLAANVGILPPLEN
ncbi:hypothetical protein EX895_001902 [Sporisorium graminicola]|uniref:Thioesterase domain-containing protein n=1 Tax=Sporisorium graminicola TaxID=280036 RepID=A0A4U7KX82_9BASI|nr:hypothetical protein EX895_001902 [Sporisorium graminicola]TKY89371.1 hypothetical protein EX895_001902 [Sporisorium graminicola]